MSTLNLYLKTKYDVESKYLKMIFDSIITGEYYLNWKGKCGEITLLKSEIQFAKLNECLDAIQTDLQDEISCIIVPYFNKIIEREINKLKRVGLFYFTEVLPLLLKENESLKDELLSFEEEVSEDILNTIKIYLQQNMSVNQTARIMFTHRNTINYRITRFIELSGIDIRETQNGYYVYLLITW